MDELVIEYPTSSLKETLAVLKAKIDQVLELKKNPDRQSEITSVYKNEIRPLLLATRHFNRENKKQLVEKNEDVRKMESELLVVQSVYDSLDYRMSYIAADAQIKRDETGIDNIDTVKSQEDHKEKMQALDIEEIRRRELHLKLSKLEEETKQLDVSCSKGERQLQEVRPYVEQLVERANTTLNLEALN